jgi:hypothetical protein
MIDPSKPTPKTPEPIPPKPKEQLIPDLKKGLVAYYPFNGNAKDESGNTYHGKITGASLTSDRHGNPNQAIDFQPGTPRMSLGNINFGNPIKGFSYALWIKVDSIPKANAVHPVSKHDSKGGLSNTTFNFYLYGHGTHPVPGEMVHYVAINNIWATAVRHPDDNGRGAAVLKVKQWGHYLVSYDGETLKYFVNGKLVESRFKSGTVGRNDDPVLIAGEAFDGQLDELRFYNRGLTDAEAKALYDLEKPAQ